MSGMKAFLRGSWILFSAHFWRTVRTRRALVMALLALFPAGLVFLVPRLSRSTPGLDLLTAVTWVPPVPPSPALVV